VRYDGMRGTVSLVMLGTTVSLSMFATSLRIWVVSGEVSPENVRDVQSDSIAVPYAN
jgi:hypothetical protein